MQQRPSLLQGVLGMLINGGIGYMQGRRQHQQDQQDEAGQKLDLAIKRQQLDNATYSGQQARLQPYTSALDTAAGQYSQNPEAQAAIAARRAQIQRNPRSVLGYGGQDVNQGPVKPPDFASPLQGLNLPGKTDLQSERDFQNNQNVAGNYERAAAGYTNPRPLLDLANRVRSTGQVPPAQGNPGYRYQPAGGGAAPATIGGFPTTVPPALGVEDYFKEAGPTTQQAQLDEQRQSRAAELAAQTERLKMEADMRSRDARAATRAKAYADQYDKVMAWKGSSVIAAQAGRLAAQGADDAYGGGGTAAPAAAGPPPVGPDLSQFNAAGGTLGRLFPGQVRTPLQTTTPPFAPAPAAAQQPSLQIETPDMVGMAATRAGTAHVLRETQAIGEGQAIQRSGQAIQRAGQAETASYHSRLLAQQEADRQTREQITNAQEARRYFDQAIESRKQILAEAKAALGEGNLDPRVKAAYGTMGDRVKELMRQQAEIDKAAAANPPRRGQPDPYAARRAALQQKIDAFDASMGKLLNQPGAAFKLNGPVPTPPAYQPIGTRAAPGYRGPALPATAPSGASRTRYMKVLTDGGIDPGKAARMADEAAAAGRLR